MSSRSARNIIAIYRNQKKISNDELIREILLSNNLLLHIIKTQQYLIMLSFLFKSDDQSLRLLKADGVSDYKHTIDNNILFLSISGLNIISCFVAPISPKALLVSNQTVSDGVAGICFHSLNNQKMSLPDFMLLVITDDQEEKIEFEQLSIKSESMKFLKGKDSDSADGTTRVKVLPEIPSKPSKHRS